MRVDASEISTVQVLLVYYCNLGCTYCYQDFNKDIGVKKMTVQTFQKILQDFQGKKIDLNLFGGEPLLNQDIIEFMLSSDFHLPENVEILSINTNGLLFNDNFMKFVEKFSQKIHIDLSLDGTKQNHDYYRKTLGGLPTYDIILQNILKFPDLSIFTINFCVGTYTSDKLFEGILSLYNLGFRKIKTIFLYEQNWTSQDLKNLIGEFLRLKTLKGKIDVSLFHMGKSSSLECREDFMKNYLILPSGEILPCLVWLSKSSHKVPQVQPFSGEIGGKNAYIEENIFGKEKLQNIMRQGAICENIQGEVFKKNQRKIMKMALKIF